MTDLHENEMAVQLLAEMAALRQSVERLSAELAGKTLWPHTELPFTRTCQEVVDRYQSTESAATALEAWPRGRAHFYDYMRRCPELKAKWQATKESVLSKRAIKPHLSEESESGKPKACQRNSGGIAHRS